MPLVVGVLLMFVGLSVISYGYVVVRGPVKFHADPVFRQRFKFVMNRWHPTWYYWGALQLARNLLLCIVPVAFTDGVTQLCMTFFVYAPVLFWTLLTWPWRQAVANYNDSVLSACFLSIVFMVGLLVEDAD